MIALAALIATSLFWYTQGAHTGWTQRVQSTARVDPLTGIEISGKLPRIIPGVDFLGGSIAVVVFLFVISFSGGSRRRRRTEQLVPLAEPETEEPKATAKDTETEPEPVESEPETEPDDDRANRLT
ncbi:MAG: hypothetical protein DRP71_16155 [Verrucomicrobia bacterium]|nr:MAG: hypothetical protein DRP71_16155 [Verrucomicrobiota bacterium]